LVESPASSPLNDGSGWPGNPVLGHRVTVGSKPIISLVRHPTSPRRPRPFGPGPPADWPSRLTCRTTSVSRGRRWWEPSSNSSTGIGSRRSRERHRPPIPGDREEIPHDPNRPRMKCPRQPSGPTEWHKKCRYPFRTDCLLVSNRSDREDRDRVLLADVGYRCRGQRNKAPGMVRPPVVTAAK